MDNTPVRRPLRIGIVVGEASGDILGAGLMAALQARHPDAIFEGVGGPRMLALGFNSLFPQERLAVMGLVEPLKRLPELLRMRRCLREGFIAAPIDVFIGIDSPDFNLALEGHLKAAGIPTLHYVSPSVWAWRRGRIKKIARSVDRMLTLLPFEAAFYHEHQVPVTFVGHPLASDFALEPAHAQARQALGIAPQQKLIALLPGSRGGEVKMHGDLFLQVARWCLARDPSLHFIVPAASDARRAQLEIQLAADREAHGELPLTLVDGQSQTVMTAADVVLMASGTTTLEALLLKRPMVVTYRMARLSYAIISRLLKSKFVALPNLLADRLLVPELIQSAATVTALGSEVMRYFDDPARVQQLQAAYLDIHQQLRCDASEKAAQAVLDLVPQG